MVKFELINDILYKVESGKKLMIPIKCVELLIIKTRNVRSCRTENTV